jgi:hypothetical protein
MKTFACLAVLGLSITGCSFRSDTVAQRPAPTTTTYVVPASPPPPTTVYVPSNTVYVPSN